MRLRLVGLLSLAALGGCGSGGPEDAINEFVSGYQKSDYVTACARVAPFGEARRALVSHAEPKVDLNDCEGLLKNAHEQLHSKLSVSASTSENETDASGNEATVTRSDGEWRLRKDVRGEWQITHLPY